MNINLDMSGVEESNSFVVFPAGDYVLRIVDTKVKTSHKGNQMLEVTFEVNETQNKLWDYFVLDNEVGKSRLKQLVIASRHPNPNFISDSEELHGRSVLAQLTVIENSQWGTQNKIKSYKPVEGIPPVIPTLTAKQTVKPVVPTAKQTAAPNAKSAPPWASKPQNDDGIPF